MTPHHWCQNPLLKIIKNHVHLCNRGRKSRAPHMPLFMYRCPIGCNPFPGERLRVRVLEKSILGTVDASPERSSARRFYSKWINAA